MKSGKLCRGLAAAAMLLGLAGLAANASAQCSANYVITPGTGGVITPGTTDINNHNDDALVAITPPFPVSLYGTSYSSISVSSNGDIQFGTPAGSFTQAYGNVCLPTPVGGQITGPALFPFWDDLYTTDAANGEGIFTTTTGTAPNRQFFVEWRTVFCCTGGAPSNNFEVVFWENSPHIDFIYGAVADRASATIGVQQGAGGQASQFECNAAQSLQGTVIHLDCPVTSAPSCALSTTPAVVAAGDTVHIHSTVIPGTPASPPYTVSVDASQIGAGTITLYDNGTHGDAVAGDGIFSNDAVVAAGTANGSYNVVSTVTDNINQSSTCFTSVNVNTVALAGTGAVNPTNAFPAIPVLFTVNVTPATGPLSTGLQVNMDLSSIGGPASQPLYDNGSHGDVTAGDNVFSFSFTTPAATPLATYTLPFSVADSQSRTASGTITLTLGYCSVSTGNNGTCSTTYEFISDVMMGSISDSEPCSVSSYQDQSSQSTTVAPGSSTPISVTVGNYWSTDHVTAFVDWNNNGSLSDSGEDTVITLGPDAGTGGASMTYTANINAPADATAGSHRMRVWLTYGTVPTACLTGQTFGQIKDYTIVVGSLCGSADFNCDGDTATDADIEAFFACVAGNCPAAPCTSTADFNGDGDSATDADIEAFFRVLAGGTC